MASNPPADPPLALPRGHAALPPELVDANQRARLIAAITAEVGERGFRAAIITSVTAAARMSRRDFYFRYKNLEACLAAAFDAGAERLLDTATRADAPTEPFPTRVDHMLSAVLDLLASEPGLARLLFAEFLPREHALAERYRVWDRRLLALLDATADDPDAAELPEPVARAVLGAIVSVLGEAALRDPTRLPELAPELTVFLAASFGVGPGGDRSAPPSPLAAELADPRDLAAPSEQPHPVVPSDPLDMAALHEFSRATIKAEQYERLLAATVRIVTTRGCPSATIIAVAAEAHVARPRLRELLGTREGILAATFESAADRLLATLDAAHSPDVAFPDQVKTGLRAGLDLLASDPTLAALLTLDYLPSSEALPERYHRLLWRLATRLRNTATECGLPAPSPLLARATVGGLAVALATEVGEGRADRLPELTDPLAAWVVSLHGSARPPAS